MTSHLLLPTETQGNGDSLPTVQCWRRCRCFRQSHQSQRSDQMQEQLHWHWETSVSLNNHAKIFLKCSGMKIHPQSDVNNPLLVCIPRQALACRWVCGSLYVFALDQLHCVGVCVCSVLSTYHSAPTPNVNSHPTALLAETPKTWALCLGDSAYYPLRVLYHGYLTGVDETTIIDVLVKRSNAQRQQIKAVYMKATGKVKHTTHKLLCLCTDT